MRERRVRPVRFCELGGTSTAREEERGEVLHLIAPWDTLHTYDMRVQQASGELPVLSGEGLEIRLLNTILYRPVPGETGLLHQEVGPDSLERMVKISDSALRWHGIDATIELARSNNTKVIMVGSGNEAPILLNMAPENVSVAPAAGGDQ